jgi:ParB family chromosome partitioning protein
MSFADEMRAKTAGLRKASEVPLEELPARGTRVPRTAPGAFGALAEAKRRIEELEKQTRGTSVVAVAKCRPNPWQPRTRFAPEAMDELVAGIREAGLIQPIIVRVDPSDLEWYQIVAGERRWRAHEMLGLEEIRAHVVDVTDSDMAVQAMLENLSREDLTDYEVSLGVKRLENDFPTRKATGEALGISSSQMSRLAAFHRLPAFILADLNERPELLGANAAEALALVIKQNPECEGALQEVWALLRQGEIEQNAVAKLLDDSLNKKIRPTNTTHVRSFYQKGAKAGYMSKDKQNYVIRLKTSLLSKEQEKELNEFWDKWYPNP